MEFANPENRINGRTPSPWSQVRPVGGVVSDALVENPQMKGEGVSSCGAAMDYIDAVLHDMSHGNCHGRVR